MIKLEDNFSDVLGKAQRGLEISDSELEKKSGANADAFRKVRDGQFDEATVRAIAPALNLEADALVKLIAQLAVHGTCGAHDVQAVVIVEH